MDTKKLRQKILDLAIRGKLVPQDPNDEPASVLLERIRAEKERLITEGKIKRPKKSKASSSESHYQNFELPFTIPDNWEWATVGEVSSSILYGVSESAKPNGKYKLLRITDIQDNNVIWDNVPFTNLDTNKVEQYILQNGDILFARTGATVGKSYLVREVPLNSIYASYLIRIRTSNEICPKYLKLFFESGYYWQQISEGAVGIGQPNVNGTSLGKLLLPVPPKTEQIRIINRAESLTELISSIDVWTGNLSRSIEQTKNKILDFAMQGKLVPQDTTDEPASDMLLRINPKAKIITDNPHYPQLPSGWCIAVIRDTFEINPKNKADGNKEAGFVPMASICDGFNNSFDYIPRKWDEIKNGFTHFANGDIAVAKISPCLENRKSMILKNLPNGIGSGTTELLVFRSKVIYPEYGLLFFKSDNFIKQCVGTFNGVVGQQRVGKNIVEEIPLPIPPYKAQIQIANVVKRLFETLDQINSNLAN